MTDSLLGDPRRSDFFLLVRALQSQYPAHYPRVGEALRVAQEPVRFGQPPFLEFAPSSVESVRMRKAAPLRPELGGAEGGGPAAPSGGGVGAESDGAVSYRKINQYFFGMFGPNGPLPLHLTEYAMSRWRYQKDPVLMEFADIFHHRMISFFFRAWADARMEVDFDRGAATSRFANYIGSLAGLGSTAPGRDSIGPLAKLHYVGHLCRQVRNEEGLADLLADYFQIQVEVQTFRGCWVDLPLSSRCQLGGAPGAGELGRTALVGSMVWDCQMTIRLRFGPMSMDDVGRFLPGRNSFRRLKDWIRLYCDQPFFWDLQMVVRKEQVKPMRLGGDPEASGESGCAARLGWTTWLATEPLARDPDDLILRPDA